MSQDRLIKMKCQGADGNSCTLIRNTTKNKKTNTEKLVLNKFCKECKAKREFKEMKK